jgi:methyl-accepting chemotaxis protein
MATRPMSRSSSSAPVGRMASERKDDGPSGAVVRWMWTWIALGILVVVTVIGFLIGIVRALESIDARLFEASSAVQGIGSDAQPLPGYVSTINSNLAEIDTALKPIRGQANDIGGGLASITSSLQEVDASLQDTDASLVDTSGSLQDTSGVLVNASDSVGTIESSLVDTTNVLVTVLDQAGAIRAELAETQSVNSLGTNLIWRNVDDANNVLDPAQADTSNIVGQLEGVNQNLEGICTSPVLMLLPPQCN